MFAFIIIHELSPGWHPLLDCLFEAFAADSDLVLWVGVVIAHGWEDLQSFQLLSDHVSCVLHNHHILEEAQALKIVSDGVTTPKHGIWLHLLSDVLQQVLQGSWWWVTLIVAPLASSMIARDR